MHRSIASSLVCLSQRGSLPTTTLSARPVHSNKPTPSPPKESRLHMSSSMSEKRQHRQRPPVPGGPPGPGGHSSRKRENEDGEDDRQRSSSSSSSSQTKRRKQAAISLASFSTKKGHDRALQEYKKRKETKFLANATLLRGYQRAMKREGYDAGKGASRKRREGRHDGDGGGDGDGRQSACSARRARRPGDFPENPPPSRGGRRFPPPHASSPGPDAAGAVGASFLARCREAGGGSPSRTPTSSSGGSSRRW